VATLQLTVWNEDGVPQPANGLVNHSDGKGAIWLFPDLDPATTYDAEVVAMEGTYESSASGSFTTRQRRVLVDYGSFDGQHTHVDSATQNPMYWKWIFVNVGEVNYHWEEVVDQYEHDFLKPTQQSTDLPFEKNHFMLEPSPPTLHFTVQLEELNLSGTDCDYLPAPESPTAETVEGTCRYRNIADKGITNDRTWIEPFWELDSIGHTNGYKTEYSEDFTIDSYDNSDCDNCFDLVFQVPVRVTVQYYVV